MLVLSVALTLLPTAVLADEGAAEPENYVTLELTYGSSVTGESIAAAKTMYEGKKYDTCKAANEAFMALYGVNWVEREGGKPYLDVTDDNAPLRAYATNADAVTEVKYYIHGTLAGFTSLLSDGNQIDCTVGGNHQIPRASISIIGVDGSDGKAKLTDGNVQAYVAGGYDSMFRSSGKLTIDNIEFTSTTSTTVGASAAVDANATQTVTSAEMEIKNCVFRGRLYVYDNFENTGMTYNIHDNVFEGSNYSGDSNAYPIFAQCRGGNKLFIKNNNISGFARGINIDHANINAVIEGNTISITDTGRSCIQLSSLATTTISGNTLNLTGGNAITLHEKLLTVSPTPEVSIENNIITGTGYLIYDDAAAHNESFTSDKLKLTYSSNTVPSTVDTTKGVKGSKETALAGYVAAVAQGKDDITGKVAQVGTEYYTTLTEAFAALDGTNHTLTLIDGSKWTYKDVYWSAGNQVGSEDTLKAAMEAAYAKNAGSITIICKPNATITKSPAHINVTGDITVYANGDNFGGNDLSIGTYAAPKDSTTTINIYDAKNLVVWGQPVDERADVWNVNFTDCVNDGWNFLMYRGETGKATINATLTGCKATGFKDSIIHTTADGSITIKNCEFANNCAPVNIAHKQTGAMTVTVENSTFTNCGSTSTENKLNQYAAPVRIVNNNAAGTVATEVTNCTFADTVGNNGDILIGDGRDGKESKDVSLTVKNTAADVQAQKPGYYAANGAVAEAGNVSKTTVTKSTKATTITNKAEVFVVAKIGDNEYSTLAAALNAVKGTGGTITLLKDADLPDAEYYINKSVTINGSGKISCTVGTGKDTRAFVIEENGSLTLDGVKLDIQGTPNNVPAEKNDGTGIDVQFGGKLVLQNHAVLKLHDLERGTIFSEPTGTTAGPGQVVINNSTFESTNIDGNASNGGDWTVTNGSTVTINNCGSYGLSVNSLTTEQSTVNISETGYSAIYGKDLQFKDGSNVLINGAGTKLPLTTIWSDARSPIQTHKDGGTIVVASGATVTVQDCVNNKNEANNTICLYPSDNTTYTNNGTVNATIITAGAPENSFVVTLVSDGKTIGVQTVAKDSEFTLPAAPEKNNYTFNGWYDGSTKVSSPYKVTKNVTLTASWSYNYSGGSSSYDPTYSVSTPSKTKNGSVTVSPKSASKGDTVTVTVKPDSGYVLETLTVTDKNGNELTLKDKGNGKYTFTMPAGKVEVKATFMEDNSMLNFFYDVPNNAYFYEAVKWAVENGITTGVGNDLFAPEQPCTRAQIVTFLWRAAGSPEPKGAASGMTDVVSGSYYEKAVAWAIENGITTGTTTSTFSPDATCTRAQAVTFLARALNAKASGKAEFSDVPADSYFADAVAWAAANGVTEGIGGGLFGSDNDCTRGQIVTFLYRAYNK